MNKFFLPLLAAFILSIVTVVGDILVKEASLHTGFSGWKWLLLGAAIYGLTAIGWLYVMRNSGLSILGVVYAVTCAVALFVLGVFVYKEQVTPMEIFGLGLGLTSVLILFRYA